jgi:hypothetical protein
MSKNTNLSFLTDYITADITNGRIGINNASPTVAFDVSGATRISGVLTLTSTISNGTYAYTLPSATGTLALTSAISGTTNYVPKFTASGTIGNSSIQDNGSVVGVNTSNLLTWFSGGYMAMQFGGMAGLLTNTSNTSVTGAFGLSYNLYTDSAGNYQYMNTTSARAGSIMNLEGGNIYFSNAPAGTGANPTVTERMRITSAGNVGIGTSSPSGLLTLGKAGGGQVFQGIDNSTSYEIGYIQFNTDNMTLNPQGGASGTTGYFRFITAGSERMRITAAGNVGIGTTSPAELLHVSKSGSGAVLFVEAVGGNDASIKLKDQTRSYYLGSSGGNYYIYDQNAAANRLLISSSGVVTITNLGSGAVTATSGVLSTTSDMTLKVEDGYIENALEKISQLKPRYFYWKEESGLPTDIRQLGFYAQEVNQALGEEAANTPKNENDKWGIYDRGIIAMLTKGIQELKAEIETLKNK